MASIFNSLADLFQYIMRGGVLLWDFLNSPLPDELLELVDVASMTWLEFGFGVGVPLVLIFSAIRTLTGL